ncbi:Meckel syndrome type 6 protein [Trypanosoma brucei equiperdum]|uniref:Meckel syndrome type 6 protein n=1 Tax=Trypanosoma brucei equiperdum TaxID=630700 RepID=A0A3L6L283_9TRYP|nr:Meckel syndrome type 6 protein [Trypanosoma brucei equiperdum]
MQKQTNAEPPLSPTTGSGFGTPLPLQDETPEDHALVEGNDAAQHFLELLSPSSRGGNASALKKGKKNTNRRLRFDPTLRVVEAAEAPVQANTEDGSSSEEDSDSWRGKSLTATEEGGLSDVPEPELTELSNRQATRRPPWWVHRWSELSLFLNSTRSGGKRGSTPVDAVRDQLSADLVAAQSLQQFVGRDEYEQVAEVISEQNQLLPGGAERNTSRMVAGLLPPWRREATGREMIEHLVGKIQGWLRNLCDSVKGTSGGDAQKVFGGEEHDGSDGIVAAPFCPAVKRAHRSMVQKSLLHDLVVPSTNIWSGRAYQVCEGLRTQTPTIHFEYVTDESVRPVFHLSCLHYIDGGEMPMSAVVQEAQKRRSLVIHIDYVRFRPSSPPHSDKTTDHQMRARGGNPSRDAVVGVPTASVSSGANAGGGEGRAAAAPVNFSPHDELVSSILDNYEPYRMMELNLLPHLKNRTFYEDQLRSLRSHRSLTEEQRRLMITLEKLHKLTCKLQHSYLSGMVTSWRQLLQLGRGNFGGISTSSEQPDTEGRRREFFAAHVSPFQVSMNDTANSFGSPSGFIIGNGESASMLVDPSVTAEVQRNACFHLYLKREGSKVDAHTVKDDRLLDYSPVIEGLTLPVGTQDEPAQHFQVLLFARTNAFTQPQFVGATEPRVINAVKVVFFNETFELHTLSDPEEILLHVIAVGGVNNRRVVTTIRMEPSLTQACLLLPMQRPIPFTHSGHSHKKYEGSVISGTACVSTNWTTHHGMAMHEIEDLFLNGDADPMDPKYRPLLNTLKDHYAVSKAQTAVSVNGVSKTGANAGDNVVPQVGRVMGPEPALYKGLPTRYPKESKRLQQLRHRWAIRLNREEPRDAAEAHLFSQPIPLDDSDSSDFAAACKHCVENREFMQTAPDELHEGFVQGSSPSCLSLSLLSRREKLKLWQQRLRFQKSKYTNSRKVEDHEIQERHVIIPKLLPAKPIHWTAESQLNPRRGKRPKIRDISPDSLAVLRDSRIVVHIMRASTLPVRSDGTPLEPFIEVSFVYETVHSRSEVGSTPSWFETLNIPFSPPDFDDDTLSLIDDDIVISVYDKVEIPMPPTTITAGVISHETHYRTERRLLGVLRVPFYSLYTAEQARMEGLYVLTTPRWSLGYHQSPREVSHGDSGRMKLRRRGLPSLLPTIQLYLALWPQPDRGSREAGDELEMQRLVKQFNVSPQLRYLHETAMRWRPSALSKTRKLSSVNPVARNRSISPFVLCTTGDLTLVCRFLLAGGGPPPITVTTVSQAIRFVSLLPLRLDMLPVQSNRAWNTNVEVLKARECKYEELSLLLAHFLRFIEPSEATYVVTGRGPIYQRVTMVLHSFDGELRLIDPHGGVVAPVHDPNFNFFTDVDMVVSHDQLWANIQISGTPHRMDWNLHDERFWFPCFNHEDENVRACLPFIAAIQRETLQFSLRDTGKEREIEHDLQINVRRALVRWRNGKKPAFHHGVAAALQKLLEEAESERLVWANMSQERVNRRAARHLNEYLGEDVMYDSRRPGHTPCASHSLAVGNPCLRMAGSPINCAYMPNDTGHRLILQRVFETAVHEAAANDVSFAAATYVRGYTREVFSMWVFLAALYRV